MASKKTALSARETNFLSADMFLNPDMKVEVPFSHDIFLMETGINGMFYVDGILERLFKLKEGDSVLLVREPKNEYDDLAIKVTNKRRQKLGYVPRAKNEVLARLMDAGKCLYAKVSRVEAEEHRMNLYIDIYMND